MEISTIQNITERGCLVTIPQCGRFRDTLHVLEIIAVPSPFVRGEVGDIDTIRGDR